MGIFSGSIKRSNTDEVRKEDENTLREVSITEFDEMIQKGVVKFQYMKKDGKTVRLAVGTRNLDLVEKGFRGGICIPKERAGYSTYFDLDVEDWRVFHDENLMGVFGGVKTLEDYLRFKK